MEKILENKNLDLNKEVEFNILELCEINVKLNKPLVFVNLTRDMFKDNKYLLNKYFKNESGQDCCYANVLAYNKKTPIYVLSKCLEKDFGRKVSLKGYKYNAEHYKFVDIAMQNEYEEDLFKDKSKEDEMAEFEADRKKMIEPIDFEAVETLCKCLFLGIKTRRVMLLDLEGIPSMINNAYDCYNKGVTCTVSNAIMNSKIYEIRKILENPKVKTWLKTGYNDMSGLVKESVTEFRYDKSNIKTIEYDLSKDYIETYQKVLRQLTGIRNEPLEYCRDLLELNEEDLWIEDIIANDCIETESYYDNVDEDEEELED